MPRILLIAADGQLGSDLARVLAGPELVSRTHRDLDVTDRTAVEAAIRGAAPRWVVNAAAFHRVDDIERSQGDELERAFLVNAVAVQRLARTCARLGARLVTFSSDYVFGAGPPGPYDEAAPPAPANAYGASKLAGELLARQASADHVVIRSSGLYGVAGASGKGGNFVETMLRLARDGKAIRVVDDQVQAPTYTADLADAIARLLAVEPAGGIYHLTSGGACSWFEFARRIFALCGLSPDLRPATSAEYGAPAPRPANSVLLNTRAAALELPPLRPWPEALRAYLRAKGHLRG